MKLLTIITLQAALSGVSAAPAPNDCLVKQRSKLKSCNGFSVDTGTSNNLAFLHAECLGYDDKGGKWTKVETGIDLNKCLANVDGHLNGRKNGNFKVHCDNVYVALDSASGVVNLTANCVGPLLKRQTSIDLGQFVTVDNGGLVCFGQN
ncbi:hypothetical protein FHL15_006952 [Xylaria flabelliformis]|uniref:Cyanovirin-N domain-containing protein n=1 Tax=Xylaria flabelliformis TaxID=2512241 RepID=A0A553HVW5_9PEZI|nr:hypothetical protein FHL15_006952 [Xylaria flabelliformis]